MPRQSNDWVLAIVAIICPPLAVWIKTGCCSADGCINIALTFLGFIPGIIHAWYIIFKTPDHYEYDDPESGLRQRGQGPKPTGPPAQQGQQRGGNYYVESPSQPQYPQQAYNQNSYTAPQQHHQPSSPYAQSSPQQPVQGYGSFPQQQSRQTTGNGSGIPPSYNEVLHGDHKVQRY